MTNKTERAPKSEIPLISLEDLGNGDYSLTVKGKFINYVGLDVSDAILEVVDEMRQALKAHGDSERAAALRPWDRLWTRLNMIHVMIKSAEEGEVFADAYWQEFIPRYDATVKEIKGLMEDAGHE